MKKILSMYIILFVAVAVSVFAVPQMINYRGKIFESGGAVNGSRNLVKLWSYLDGVYEK